MCTRTEVRTHELVSVQGCRIKESLCTSIVTRTVLFVYVSKEKEREGMIDAHV